MSIKKYLARIELPEPQPGPFAMRLKYELRRELFERRRNWGWYPAFSTGLAGGMLVFISVLVVQPHWASTLHASLFGRPLPALQQTPTLPVPAESGVAKRPANPSGETGQALPGERIVNGIALPANPDRLSRNITAQNDTTRVGRQSFPSLDEDKSYLIRRVKVSGNRSVYYVSELKENTPKIIY